MFEGEGAATTVGSVAVDDAHDIHLDVEERDTFRMDKCDLFCCGCMLRC